MSTTYRTYGVIGVRLSYDDIAGEEKLVPSCDHPQRNGNTYCPVCGKKVEEVLSDAPNTNQILGDIVPPGSKFSQLGSSEDEGDYLIGLTVEGLDLEYDDPTGAFARIPDLAKLKNDLKDALEPLGLWDETTFGLHTGMYVS